MSGPDHRRYPFFLVKVFSFLESISPGNSDSTFNFLQTVARLKRRYFESLANIRGILKRVQRLEGPP